ncbi:hypothetical protein OPIT5_30875 [Opitutaceae bacterium TAV5]|nr:hypothetical protein OPIT5_30875 [Opitutaceae bacterium TAV5]
MRIAEWKTSAYVSLFATTTPASFRNPQSTLRNLFTHHAR